MTLTRLLGIEARLLSKAARGSMEFAEEIWTMHGRPVDGPSLVEVLEEVLQSCRDAHIRYAPILLRRKKELERGEWSPLEVEEWAPEPEPQLPRPKASGIDAAAEDIFALTKACQVCGGKGSVFVGDRSRLCACVRLN